MKALLYKDACVLWKQMKFISLYFSHADSIFPA